ncbi:redoxin family protein [Desulfobacterales bacterium HSG16]|nr:redoxin family protein [Desulfobacterales bacterium HSG16]
MKTKFFCIKAMFLFSALFLYSTMAICGQTPKSGAILPDFTFTSPSMEKDIQYLGLAGKKDFEFETIEADIMVIEIIGVYCAVCYKQAPQFNKLFKRLKKKKDTGKIKMLAVAAGGTANEIMMLREKNTYKFPVISDLKYEFHKLLGEPRTPFTMVVSADGKILDTHLGLIKDMDAFYKKLKKLAKK